MITALTGKSKKKSWIDLCKKKSQSENVSEVIIEKKVSNSDTNVSVFTKTTEPKVVIQSENVDISKVLKNQSICKHRLMKSICMITITVIILITFFLSLKTYNIVSELSQSLN